MRWIYAYTQVCSTLAASPDGFMPTGKICFTTQTRPLGACSVFDLSNVGTALTKAKPCC